MTETVSYQQWWRLSINGHAIHVNDDGSYWWWDRLRMFGGRWRPRFYLRAKGSFRPRGRLATMQWFGKCTPWETPNVERAFTYRGLNIKSKRASDDHYRHCQHPENHAYFPPEYR